MYVLLASPCYVEGPYLKFKLYGPYYVDTVSVCLYGAHS